MICPICKNEIPDKAKFCGKCGSEIPRCPTCGKVLTKKVKYCVSDGTAIPERVLALFPASELVTEDVPPVKPKTPVQLQGARKTEKKVEKKKKMIILPLIIIILLLLLTAALLLYLIHGRERFGNTEKEAETSSLESSNIDEDSYEDRDSLAESMESESEESEKNEDSKVSEENSEAEKANESSEVLVELEPPKGAYTEVALSSASATSVLEPESDEYHYEPYRAIDNDTVTSWQEGAKGDGIGEKLTIYLSKKSNVKYISLWGGNWRADEQFRNNNRPKDVKISIGEKEYSVRLSDGKKEKYIVFQEPIETNQIVFTFESVYKGVTSEDLCISEVKVYS